MYYCLQYYIYIYIYIYIYMEGVTLDRNIHTIKGDNNDV